MGGGIGGIGIGEREGEAGRLCRPQQLEQQSSASRGGGWETNEDDPPRQSLMEQAHDEIIWAIEHHRGRIYTAPADGTCRVWDAQTRRCLHVFDDHRRPVLCIAIVKGRYLCTGGYDHRINVYEMKRTEGAEAEAEGNVDAVDVSYRHVATLEGHTDAVRSLIVADDGRLVSGSYDSTCRCWAFKDVSETATTTTATATTTTKNNNNNNNVECVAVMEGHVAPVRALAAVGSRLFSGSYDGTVRCWDLNTGACLGTLKGHAKPVRALVSVRVSTGRAGNTDVIASGSDDTTVRIWDAQTLRSVAVLKGHTDNVRSLSSVPGKYVISASWDKTIRVFDVTSWQEVAVLRGHSEAVLALAVCPEADLVVSGSFDCTVRSWSLKDFRCVSVYDVHRDAVRVVRVRVDVGGGGERERERERESENAGDLLLGWV